MRSLFPSARRMAFMEKLCINQTDDTMKEAGIRSFAGFLRNTDRIVILCVFEVTCWVHLEKDVNRSVLFMPVAWSSILIILHAGYLCYFALKALQE